MSGLRPPLPGELAAVQAVGLAAGRRFAELDDPRLARHAEDPPLPMAVLGAALEEHRLLAAVEARGGKGVLGFVLLEELDGRAHIEEVSVAPKAQGRGVGRSLLAAAAGWADERGLDGVTLTTFRDVPWNAPWYERRGYRVLDRAEWTPGLAAKVADEAAAGLDPELRVAMWQPPGAGA